MDITDYVAHQRETLIISDYGAYRAHLSRRLLALRKKLGRATAKREKFTVKAVTAEDIGVNHEFAHLMLLTSERAWAHAMYIKTSHTDNASGKGITGPTRSHIISRLSKAEKKARELSELLKDGALSKARQQDLLEARAYHASLAGAEEFEKHSSGQRTGDGKEGENQWSACLKWYAEARVIYAALLEKEKKEIYRDMLAGTIDPTIRYAAYQAHISRTIAIATVAKRYFPRDDAELVKAVEERDPYALKDKPAPKGKDDEREERQDIPTSISWRGRKANIVDASIGQALANVVAAEGRLRSFLTSTPAASAKEKAAAYDDILIASQDAADAARSATEELEKEKIDEGDARMQDLRVTGLSVNYDLVSWRVGRNRILIGEDDGLTLEPQRQKVPKRLQKDGTEYSGKEEPRGRKLGRLRERVVLYDATIQSIESIKELRGAMRDAQFVTELDQQVAYFRALKCLNIAISHSLLEEHVKSLALIKRAEDLLQQVPETSASTAGDEHAPPTLNIQPAMVKKVKTHVHASLSRAHAVVEMRAFETNAAIAAAKHMSSAAPLVQRLDSYPTPGTLVDVHNLVPYPPKLEPVPVKPLFLDVAFNYIEYPGRTATTAPVERETVTVNGAEEKPAPKKGWFGFGR